MSWYKLTLIEWMLHDNEKKEDIKQTENKSSYNNTNKVEEYWTDKDMEMQEIKSEEEQKTEKKETKVVSQPDITHIDAVSINEWK